MNETSLTHVKSLDPDTIDIPGLDIEKDLLSAIELGRNKVRTKKLIVIISSFSAIFLVTLAMITAVLLFNNENSQTNVLADRKNETVETKVGGASKTAENNSQNIQPTTPETSVPVTPTSLVVLQYGDVSQCTKVSNEQDSDVQISNSTNVEFWQPAIGEKKSVYAGESGHELILENIYVDQSGNGSYINLASGYDKNSSYANVLTTGLTYCENGYTLKVFPLNGGYTIEIQY